MNAMAELTTVVFDLDDTLMPEYGPVAEAFARTCQIAAEQAGVDRDTLHETIRTRARELWHAGPVWDYCLRIGISSWEGLTTGGFDMGGAHGVGMKAIWVNMDGEVADGSAAPDAEVSHIGQVPQAIAQF